jgi:hypothetical protein
VTACGCSLLLRRRLVDFSSERSMEGAAQALKEHYGINLSASVINKVTRETGIAAKAFNAEVAAPAKSVDVVVVQIDGSMVPTVEYGEASVEQKAKGMKRKRECLWKEFRLCTASRPGEEKTRYGVTDGSPFEAGCMMYQTARAEGMGEKTHIHGVGDGAPWIEEQFEEQFGANHSFLIDFYHVGEYLGAAAKEAGDGASEAGKYREWKDKMLADKAGEVITELGALHQEHPQKEAVESCHRYLSNRTAHLGYAKALAEGLPIGSGEVESGHRSVLQKRLKKPGAWWRKPNAESMAQLKTLQANEHWENLWEKLAA